MPPGQVNHLFTWQLPAGMCCEKRRNHTRARIVTRLTIHDLRWVFCRMSVRWHILQPLVPSHRAQVFRVYSYAPQHTYWAPAASADGVAWWKPHCCARAPFKVQTEMEGIATGISTLLDTCARSMILHT